MKTNDYSYYIAKEIDLFECTYNKSPERIIMSSALANRIMSDLVMYNNEYYDSSNVIIGSFAGIPFMVYPSHKLDCHLVEHTFELH